MDVLARTSSNLPGRPTALLGKVKITHFVKKFPSFADPQKFITAQSSQPLDPTLNKINPSHVLSSYFFRLIFNIILLPTSGLLNGPFLSDFPAINLYQD
jgi:hypothetical protein